MKILKKKIDINSVLNFCIVIILMFCTEWIIVEFASIRTTMTSSMEPTFQVGGLQIDRAYLGETIKRGVAIGFDYPYGERTHLGKRVIGLPGETVKINKNGVYINGKLLNEPYVAKDADYKNIDATFVVPKDCYFVMGDNRNNSKDSRYMQEPFIHKDWITRVTYATIDKKGLTIEDGASVLKENNLNIPNF